jgi:Domain of unknown function (DUF5615)
MPRSIRFHLDENCAASVAAGLRRQAVDVTTSREARLLGVPDQEQMAYALAENRVIFTQDQDFLRIHSSGRPHAGIAYCAKGSRSIGEIIDGLLLIWELLEPEEMANRVEFV